MKMTRLLAIVRAIITRLVFACHSIVAIWQVTVYKKEPNYWLLALPTLLLILECIFTLTIKETQEWKWFCPSVFIYLGCIVPSIWILELHKVEKRIQIREEQRNFTFSTGVDMKELSKMLGGKLQLPEIPFSTETWISLLEQFLMLALIIGRWMLPKGELTRDQLSQLLLVYIGTAADIIEFFDSFKDDKIVSEPILVLLILSIWSWSLLQFTVVITATKGRKSRVTPDGEEEEKKICSIDVYAIVLTIALQDAPFLIFRLLIIFHYEIVNYMNVFFACKNTLVILLQIYRLYVLHSETKKKSIENESDKDIEIGNIAIIYDAQDIVKYNQNKNIAFKAHLMKKDGLNQCDIAAVFHDTLNCINETRNNDDQMDESEPSITNHSNNVDKPSNNELINNQPSTSNDTAKHNKVHNQRLNYDDEIVADTSGTEIDMKTTKSTKDAESKVDYKKGGKKSRRNMKLAE